MSLINLIHVLCCQFISDDASPNELKLQSSYDNDKIDINLGGDSGGGGGGAELANRGMSSWTGYCQCFSHLAHDLV